MTKNQQNRRTAALNGALKRITRSSFARGGRRSRKIETIPTGSLALDCALGIGGYPKGRIIEIYGPESSGKTTLALCAVAETQKHGGIAAYVDAENALDPTYARHLGVNIDNLLLSQPDTGEQGLRICEDLASSGAVDLIVVDSVAALVPRAEIEAGLGKSRAGLQARLMSRALRKLSRILGRTRTVCIFINQIRQRIGVTFGNPDTTPGGRALKFSSTIRLAIQRGPEIKKGSNVVGNRAIIKVVKNKVAPPFKRCYVDIMYGAGVSRSGELLRMSVEKGFVKKVGTQYWYNWLRIGRDLKNAKRYLLARPRLMNNLNVRVRKAFGLR